MTDNSQPLSTRRIFRFWLPLAATWWMMALEGPFVGGLVARMAEPKYNLAAFGVAWAVAMLFESPVVMIMSASNALAKDHMSVVRLRRFTVVMSLIMTGANAVILIPSLFDYLTLDLAGLDPVVAQRAWPTLAALLPITFGVAYRRLFQGLLIRNDQTKLVGLGTVIRLSSIAVSGLILAWFFPAHGAAVGAGAISFGIVVEAVVARLMAAKQVRRLAEEYRITPEAERNPGPSYGRIIRFYYPLALTAILMMGLRPMVTFMVSHSRMALESLAVLPVIQPFIFLFVASFIAYQEVGIALLGENNRNYPALMSFIGRLTLIMAAAFALVAFTPLTDLWFGRVCGLSAELTKLSHIPVQILAVVPFMAAGRFFQRALLVNSQRTGVITWATGLETVVVAAALLASIQYFDVIGATAASIGLVSGGVAANIFMFPYSRRCLNQPQPTA